MTDQVELAGIPALGGLYRRSLVRGALLAARRGSGHAPASLPDLVYEVHGVPVDTERLTAYQAFLGMRAADRLPAGFVHTMAFPLHVALMVRDDFPLAPAGMIHVANRVTQHRPLFRDDRLDVRVRATDLRPHRSGTQLDFVAEAFRSGSSDVAWQGISTYLAKGVRLAGEASADDDERAEWVPPAPTASWNLPADTGRRYADVSGDRNPVHLTALTARPFGFAHAIAHGMYTAARALADVGPAAGHTFVWTADFTKPLLLPATVAVSIAPDGEGFCYSVWKPGGGRPYLTGGVQPLAG
jgi:acyl dehydratase